MNSKIIIGVLGIPIRNYGQDIEFFLTQRIAPKKHDIHQKWQFAGGGLEPGETPEQTLIREFKEELSVIPKIIFPYPIITTTFWGGNISEHKFRSQVLLLAYLVNIGTQKPVNTDPDHETGDMGWFTLEKISQLNCLPNTHKIINQAQVIIKML